MDEFNPTKKDLLLIDELILNIKAKKQILVGRKMSLENSLRQLAEKYKEVSFKSKDFNRIKTTRSNIKTHLNGIELQIKSCNEELIFKNKLRNETDFHVRHNKNRDHSDEINKVINKLSLLKTKYSDFTKDRTRIASLRVMASEFIDEIETIIKTI